MSNPQIVSSSKMFKWLDYPLTPISRIWDYRKDEIKEQTVKPKQTIQPVIYLEKPEQVAEPGPYFCGYVEQLAIWLDKPYLEVEIKGRIHDDFVTWDSGSPASLIALNRVSSATCNAFIPDLLYVERIEPYVLNFKSPHLSRPYRELAVTVKNEGEEEGKILFGYVRRIVLLPIKSLEKFREATLRK